MLFENIQNLMNTVTTSPHSETIMSVIKHPYTKNIALGATALYGASKLAPLIGPGFVAKKAINRATSLG